MLHNLSMVYTDNLHGTYSIVRNSLRHYLKHIVAVVVVVVVVVEFVMNLFDRHHDIDLCKRKRE